MDIGDFQNQLHVVNGWIKSGDQKISILIATIAGSFGFFANKLADLVSSLISRNNLFLLALLSIWITLVGWTLVKLLFALSPVTNNTGNSLLYFGHVADMDHKEYTKNITKLSRQAYTKALIEQIYINSCIANRKHRLLSESVRILLASAIILSCILIFKAG